MVLYEIVNRINNKKYIGQTIQKVSYRWDRHKKLLKKNKHTNIHLQRAWNKDGEYNFDFKIVKICDSLKELNEYEDRLIQKNIDGYNIRAGGDNRHHSDETKQRMSESAKNRINIPQPYPSHLHTDESKKKRQLAKIPKGGYPKVVSPDGTSYSFDNLAEFCREWKLDPPGLRMVIQRKWKYYKGWKLEHTPINDLNKGLNISKRRYPNGYPDLIFSDGTIYRGIKNMSDFRKEHNIRSSSGMSELVTSKILQYKGWRIYKPTYNPPEEHE